MKIKSLLVAVLLMGGVLVAPAHATEKPLVESFTFSPQEIELSGASTEVSFELVVSHPSGIENSFTTLSLQNSRNDTLATYLTRTDSNSTAKRVTFKGLLTVPRNINLGVYTFSASSIRNNASAGYQYGTGSIEGGKVRNLVGAESGLLVRSGGDLNFEYETFVGPSFDSTLGISFNNPARFNSLSAPIWKVGETIDATQYFELRVPSLSLALSSSTPEVCTVNGKFLNLLKEGSCSFAVSTAKTQDYLARTIGRSATVTSARVKPTLAIDKIANQEVKNLGATISIGRVFSVSEGYVLPQSATPTICFASGFYVKLIAGGTCKLTYQTAATSTYLASDLYTQSFEILSDGKPVVAPTPVVIPTPVATPTPTAKPVMKKTITCTKGTKSVKRTGTNPKCPSGYKLKK